MFWQSYVLEKEWTKCEPKGLCQNITYLENNALDALGLLVWRILSNINSTTLQQRDSMHTPAEMHCSTFERSEHLKTVMSDHKIAWFQFTKSVLFCPIKLRITVNRSNLSNATDLSAWHVEATPLPGNMLKDQDRLSGKISSYRNSKLLNQGNQPPGGVIWSQT